MNVRGENESRAGEGAVGRDGLAVEDLSDTRTDTGNAIIPGNFETDQDLGRTPGLYPVQSHIQHPQSLLREALFVGVLCLSQLFTQASLGQAVAPLHIIGDTFHTTNAGQLSWFSAAYSLTVGTFILIAGRLGDLYGHKRLYIGGFIWYGIWSLMCGFTAFVKTEKGAIFFDVCRAMQGIGPAFLLPNALAILGRTYPSGRRKEMVFSIFGATAPNGFVLGACFTSIFAEWAWWPWGFWTMGIICFVLSFLALFAIPNSPGPIIDHEDGESAWTRCDGLGSITGITALILINFAWNQGPVVGWSTPYVYVLLIIGFLILGVFGWVESRASCPLLPIEALGSDTAFILGCIAAGWSSFGIWTFYFWSFVQELRGVTPLLGTAQMSPVCFSGLAAAITTGFILSKVPASAVMMISMLAFTIGGTLMATAPVSQTYWAQTFVSILIMPWGMDMSFPAATILLSNRMKREHQGVAASLVNTAINYSISIGLGFAGTVETQVSGGDLLKGYRGAQYMGIGLSGLGVGVAFLFGLAPFLKRNDTASKEDVSGEAAAEKRTESAV